MAKDVLWLIYAGVIALTMVGCGKTPPKKLQLHSVSGKLLFNGKPPTNAILTFHPSLAIVEPSKKAILPIAKVGNDGTYKVGFYTESDGAPVGEYSITIAWPLKKIEAGEEVAGPDQLQGRYDDKLRPAAKFTVKEGENKIPDINLR